MSLRPGRTAGRLGTYAEEDEDMARLRETIEVATSIEEAFDYVADFSTTARWDPGIAEAVRVGDGPIGVGSRFDVIAVFNGRRLPLTYEIVEYDRPNVVVLRGEGPSFRGLDRIGFTREGDTHTRIDYAADVELTGVAKLAEPFMRGRFDQMGRKAVGGLKATLDG
jgi:carbon monoxide dehydrogenase subunit G